MYRVEFGGTGQIASLASFPSCPKASANIIFPDEGQKLKFKRREPMRYTTKKA
jgi:hypothetical protein